MIAECVVWKGSKVSTYQDEVDGWVGTQVADLGDVEHLRLSLADYGPDDDTLLQLLSDDSFWIDDSKVVTLDYINAWKADSVNDLIKRLTEQQTQYRLALIQRDGNVLKSVERAATEEVRYRLVPWDHSERAEWVVEWLEARGVRIERRAADSLADYTSEDLDGMIEVVLTLSRTDITGRLTWDDVLPHLGDRGAVPLFELTTAIAAGDKSQALLVLDRLSREYHPLAVLKMLVTRYRNYCIAVDSSLGADDLSGILRCTPGAARFISSEARKLGKRRVTICFGLVTQANSDLKGYGALDQNTTLQLLVTRLAQHFYLA